MKMIQIVLAVCFFLAFIQTAQAVEIQKVRSDNKVEAWLVEDHTNPIITVSFAFRGGSTLDPTGKEGLANFVSGLLDEGAGDLDSQAFRGQMDDYSISLSFRAGLENLTGNLTTLSKNKDRAFNLLRLALSQPRFDDVAVERIRGQIQAGLRQSSQNPNDIASEAFYKALFPKHPYARPSEGSAHSVKDLKAPDFKAFVKTRLAKDNLVIGVVGDITPEVLKGLIDKTFSALPDKASPWQVAETVPARGNGPVIIDRAIPQSLIRIGQKGVKRLDKDFYPAYVLNHILGGGSFSSRLYKEIREKRGLSYSPYSYLSPLKYSSVLAAGAGTANDKAGETLAILRKEWKRMATEGATAEEVENAKTYLTGSYPLRFNSSSSIASILVSMRLANLGVEFLTNRNKQVAAVTLDQVNAVAKKLLDPDNLVTVIVGQPEGIDP